MVDYFLQTRYWSVDLYLHLKYQRLLCVSKNQVRNKSSRCRQDASRFAFRYSGFFELVISSHKLWFPPHNFFSIPLYTFSKGYSLPTA
jgi:hypothetical protein